MDDATDERVAYLPHGFRRHFPKMIDLGRGDSAPRSDARIL